MNKIRVERIVIVSRTSDMIEPYSPSERRICAHCNQEVWVSKIILADAEIEHPIFLCTHCLMLKGGRAS